MARGTLMQTPLDDFKPEDINNLLAMLSEREAKIIRLRCGLDSGQPRTLEEVGKMLNITRERTRQIEANAIRKLRHPSKTKMLKDYNDESSIPAQTHAQYHKEQEAHNFSQRKEPFQQQTNQTVAKGLTEKKVAIALLITFLLALLPWPYGVFQLIRLLVTFGFIFLAVSSLSKAKIPWFYMFSALLFQPFLKVSLGRELWMFVDIVMAIVFFVLLCKGHFETNKS